MPDTKQTSCDRFLGGRLEVTQPKSGAHRSGLDAVLLGALLPEDAHGTLMDLGSGVGVAGLAALAHNPELDLMLIDNDPVSLDLARGNAERHAKLAGSKTCPRVLNADITLAGSERRQTGLTPQSADFVISNPPYNETGKSRSSPHAEKAHAHMLDNDALQAWINTAIWLLKPKGELFMILRTTRLPLTLSTLGNRLGGVTILPVHARSNQPAARAIITGRQGSRAAFRMLPGLVLHGPSGSDFLPDSAAIFAGEKRVSLQ